MNTTPHSALPPFWDRARQEPLVMTEAEASAWISRLPAPTPAWKRFSFWFNYKSLIMLLSLITLFTWWHIGTTPEPSTTALETPVYRLDSAAKAMDTAALTEPEAMANAAPTPRTAAAPMIQASDTVPVAPAPLAFDSMPLIVLSAAELMEGFQVRITYRHNDTFDQQQVEFLLARDTNFRQSADTQVAPWFYSNRDGFFLTDLLNGTFFGRPMQQVTITKRHHGPMLTKKVLFNKLGKQLPPDTVLGKRFAAMEQRFQRSLSDHLLLPIWVRPDSLITHPEILNGMIFWFPVNQRVFDRLPAAIGEPLRQEFQAISGSVPPAVPAPPPPPPPPSMSGSVPAPPAAPSCRYFESCQTDFHGLDALKVYPNPAHGHVNLTFNLLQSYHLQVNLVDIQGKPVANLMPFQAVSGGRHQYQLNLAGITPGMYLVVVTSADGTSSAKRLLIH